MGKLFNELDHKKELQAWIEAYAGYENVTAGNPPASLEYLMRFWEQAKSEYLYKMFDGQFIIEKTVSLETPRADVLDQMWNALTFESEMSNFKDTFRDWLNSAGFPSNVDTDLWYLVSPDFLTDNEYRFNTHKISVNGTTVVIQKGCKPIKVLAKIAELAGLEGFEKFRIAHSNILGNKKKATGTLCLSIHPLDYITMSDNENGWDSCMNWVNAGCYRIGTVEMMNSPAVVVAYLKSHKPMRFYDSEWNSKKWRNLFIVDKDFITGIKGYPYQDPYLDETCIDILMDLAEKNLSYRYDHNIVEHSFEGYSDEVEFPELDRNVDFRFSTNWMYNDFGNGNTTHMVVAPDTYDVNFLYSGTPECMYCGTILDDCTNYDEDETSSVICSDCMQLTRCAYCNEIIQPGDECELDGQIVCSDCYENNVAYDPFNEETHDRENMDTVFLMDDIDMSEDDHPFESYLTFVNLFTYVNTTIHDLPRNIREKIHTTEIKRYSHSDFNWFEYVNYIRLSEIEDEDLKEYLKEIYRDNGLWM